MNQFNSVDEMNLLSNSRSKKLTKDKYTQWVWRVLLWILFIIFIRFIYLGEFYRDKTYILDQLTVFLTIQTIVLYYIFTNYVFSYTLYQQKIYLLLLCILISHMVIYESNYILFWYLHKVSNGGRVSGDWLLFQEAGLTGFLSSAAASFYSFFWSFPFAIMFLTARAVKDSLAFRNRNLQLERDKLNLELDFLKAQVNPHFLFNTLNSIYSEIFDSNEKAADLVLRLSELMRYNLYETDLSKIALDKELGYVQNYLDLERSRFTDRAVLIDYEQHGNPEVYQIAPLLLIAFVENAFKHGVKGATQPAYVQVSANTTEGALVFSIQNSIPVSRPVESREVVRSGGIGLGNVRRRLDALYDGRYKLTVSPAPDSYTVVLTIQLEKLRG